MSIPVTVQPDPDPPFERCCFCRVRSPTWFAEKDVAVCVSCAETHDPSEVPTKAEWCAKEERMSPRPRWDLGHHL